LSIPSASTTARNNVPCGKPQGIAAWNLAHGVALLRAQQYTWARLNEEIDFHGRMHAGWLCPNPVVAVTRGWARLQTAVCTTGMRRPLEGVVVSDTLALPPPGSARTSTPLSEREESPRITQGVRRDRLSPAMKRRSLG
jgi:hypothetical protein